MLGICRDVNVEAIVFKVSLLCVINWQPLCAGQYGKYDILIGSEAWLYTDQYRYS